MADDTSFFDTPSSMFDDDDSHSRQLAKIISPIDANDLIPKGPPPDSAPPTQPGVSTPRTGTLAYAPTQAIAKNQDSPVGRTAYNGSPAGVAAAAPMPVMPGVPAGQPQQVQPASLSNRSASPRTVIRDLNGKPAGSSLSMLSAQQNGGSAAASQAGPGSVMPAGMGNGSPYDASPVRPVQPAVAPGRYGVMPVRPAALQAPTNGTNPAQLNLGSGSVMPQLNAQTQAYGNMMRLRAQYPGPTTLDATPSSIGASSSMPLLPATASPIAPAGQQRLAQDTARLQYLQDSGSGVDQIKNPVGRGFARAGDIALSTFARGIAPLVPGSTAHHNMLLDRQLGVVGGDQSQVQAAAQLADTQSQMNQRDAMGRRYDAQANLYNPEPLSAGKAQALGHPEWEGLKLDARDAERLVGGAAHNQTQLQTHFGGQQRKLSADDAAAINMPSLEGSTMSNDEYQRTLQQLQRNTQSDRNNTRSNDTRVTTTGMNDANRITTTGMHDSTSTANNERTHPGGGTAKPIPPGIRDRIESQKQTALSKARSAFDNGESSMDDYLDSWQQAQNDYEDRLSAQTGGPIPHTDIRSNVDDKGNWTGKGQRAAVQPQAQPGRQSGFTTQKGNRVALRDRVTVGGRSGIVTGFNARTGKAQVQWDSKN